MKYTLDFKLKNNIDKSGEVEEYSFSPESIISTLFYFHNQSHFNHLQTRSFARHKALDELYSELVSFKDEVSELLLGYIALKRLSNLNIKNVSSISDDELVDDIIKFSRELSSYAKINNYIQLDNLSAELEGLASKVKYLFTLS